MITKKILMILILSCSMVGSSLGLTLDKIPDSRLDVTAFCCDSSETRLFVGLANASLWCSNNSGVSWTSLNSEIPTNSKIYSIEDLFTLDRNADTVFCKVWIQAEFWQYVVSIDGGMSWQKLDIEANTGYSHHLIVDKYDHSKFYYIEAGEMFYSDDFGETWESWIYDQSFNQKSCLLQHPDSSNVFFLSGFGIEGSDYGGVFKSIDYGRNWSSVTNVALHMNVDEIYVDDIDILSNGKMVVCSRSGRNIEEEYEYFFFENILVQQGDNGEWHSQDVGLPLDFSPYKLYESIFNQGEIYLIGKSDIFTFGHGIYKSEDYGDSFERIDESLPQDLRYIYEIYQNTYNETTYLLSQSHGVIKSGDGGQSWQQIDLNMHLGNAIEFQIDGDFICTKSYQSADNISIYNIETDSWLSPAYPYCAGDTTLAFNHNIITNNNSIYALVHKYSFDQNYSSAQVIKSEDHGENWIYYGNPLVDNEFTKKIEKIYCGETISRILVFSQEQNNLLVHTSIDTGLTWSSFSFPSSSMYHSDQIAQTDEFISVLIPGEGVYRSNNNGITWDNLEFPDTEDLDGYYTFLMVNSYNNHLFVFGNFRAWEFNNEEWIDRGTSLSSAGNMSDICIVDSDTPSFIATNWDYNRLWYRSSLDVPWENLEVEAEFLEESRNLVYTNYDSERERIWVSNQLGLYWFDIAQLGVKDQPIQLYPAGYEVLTTYPNPFNASTKIEFILEKTNDVSLKLYDINGRLVRKLLDEKREAGKHTLSLDGSQLASGTYFLRLDDGQQIHNKKVVLVK